MTFLATVADVFLHLDVHLREVLQVYGTFTYAILFLIVFCETGLVFVPFLPGDSLLFAAGAFSGKGLLNVWVLIVLFWIAAILGDTLNYHLGKFLGRKVFKDDRFILSTERLRQAEKFFELYGHKAILFARFVPVMRTLAPFVAGIGRMSYPRFLYYNVLGATVWVFLFVSSGHFFGHIRIIKEHFSLAILAIIVVSLVPGLFHWLHEWWKKTHPKKQ